MALASPLGTFFPPNISMHLRDGIGTWRGVDFANAVMAGLSPDGRHYYPALPYVDYARMQPQDIADLWAYMRSLPAAPGRTPAHDVVFPFSIRRAIGLWKRIYLMPRPLPEDPTRDAAWNRGRYLVETVSHCSECHAARGLLMAIDDRTRLAGGKDQEGTGFVPNITQARLAAWSEDDLVRVLTEGVRPDGRRVASSMADVVLNTASLPEADRRAIARYVLGTPAKPTPQP